MKRTERGRKISEKAKARWADPKWRARMDSVYSSKLDPQSVAKLYASGLSQGAIGEKLGSSQASIYRLMTKHGIKSGRNVDMAREKNPGWKGDAAGKSAFHHRVYRIRGNARICYMCDSFDDPNTIYDWANLTGHYEDPEDYIRLCRSCHSIIDCKGAALRDAAGNWKVEPYTYRPRGKFITAT